MTPKKPLTFKAALRAATTVTVGVHMHSVYHKIETTKAAVRRSGFYDSAPSAHPTDIQLDIIGKFQACHAEDAEGRVAWYFDGTRLEIG